MLDLAQTLRSNPDHDVRELCELALRLDQKLCNGEDLPEDWLTDEDEFSDDPDDIDEDDIDDEEGLPPEAEPEEA